MAISIPYFLLIEHLGDIIGRRIYVRNGVNNVSQLEAALLEEWANIPFMSINKLFNNMRKPCTAVIDKKATIHNIEACVTFRM